MKTPEETRSRPVAPIVNSADDWRAEILRLAQKKTPSFFHLTRFPQRAVPIRCSAPLTC